MSKIAFLLCAPLKNSIRSATVHLGDGLWNILCPQESVQVNAFRADTDEPVNALRGPGDFYVVCSSDNAKEVTVYAERTVERVL